VELILSEGIEHKVIVETGSNLLNDITIEVVNDELQLSDNNTCNFVREYGITKIYVNAPNITEIRSSTQFNISSEGILSFSSLKLISEDFNHPDSFTIGDFNLNLNSEEVRVVSNNISSFFISGLTQTLNISFPSGNGRFEGENLIAQYVNIFHRGSNDIIVNPIEVLSGELRGTGDLISVNQPNIVDVEQYYTGQLIIN
ncbi:MAG: DUF2807 domain-containing protein, partial [Bacteroidia bacterium]|nr:DUF2807 domain-containing protein [Bacteroidia bacterium]